MNRELSGFCNDLFQWSKVIEVGLWFTQSILVYLFICVREFWKLQRTRRIVLTPSCRGTTKSNRLTVENGWSRPLTDANDTSPK
jgi:hypothetical protein